jgi:hypothetical protein
VINCRLDDFGLQIQEALDLIKPTVDQQGSSNSHFFPHSHVIISGGMFNLNNNPVIHDPVVREQVHQILQQATYIKTAVLFV